ncbi:MAG: enoyl-CoA hydratase/isomerase family protein [Ignavibacteriales bacterium]|nr:enoyl-CoA hydratase/isomerase family protein [Ignavibacteriales bacterium]
MKEEGNVQLELKDGIGTITFFNSKGNSLHKSLLHQLTDSIIKFGQHSLCKVILLKSGGSGSFCTGASLDELAELKYYENSKEFFHGFAKLIFAMINSGKFIITRVQGKAVGGGVGIIAASDYALALDTASIKLSELDLGIGPFVISPIVERKIGIAASSAMTIDTGWRDAGWAKHFGLYANTFSTLQELDEATNQLVENLSKKSPEAMTHLKSILWNDKEELKKLLEDRAEISAKLILSNFTKNFLANFLRTRSTGDGKTSIK